MNTTAPRTAHEHARDAAAFVARCDDATAVERKPAAQRAIDKAWNAIADGRFNDARNAATRACMAQADERHARKALIACGVVEAL